MKKSYYDSNSCDAPTLRGFTTPGLTGIPISRFVSNGDSVALCPLNVRLTPFNDVIKVEGWGTDGDAKLVYNKAEKSAFEVPRLGFRSPFNMTLADWLDLDGSPSCYCVRSRLKKAMKDLEVEANLKLMVAFEHEFLLHGENLPKASSRGFSFDAVRRIDPFGSHLYEVLKVAGLNPESFHSECGRNQFEVQIAPSSPIEAADRAIVLRELTKDLARHYGWSATFSPLLPDSPHSNGVHIHFSLRNAENGEPVSYNASQPHNLSKKAASFCAGILRHLPAITAFTASSVASYSRLHSGKCTPSYVWMGDKERGASLRICPISTIGDVKPEEQCNVEFRVCDATANPHLALEVIIRAGLEGLKYDLVPSIQKANPNDRSRPETAGFDAEQLPESLESALQKVRDDKIVMDWFPEKFMAVFLSLKETDIARFSKSSEEQIAAAHSEAF